MDFLFFKDVQLNFTIGQNISDETLERISNFDVIVKVVLCIWLLFIASIGLVINRYDPETATITMIVGNLIMFILVLVAHDLMIIKFKGSFTLVKNHNSKKASPKKKLFVHFCYICDYWSNYRYST